MDFLSAYLLLDARMRPRMNPEKCDLAVRPDLPGEVSLGVGRRLPVLDEDIVAGDWLDGFAQQPFSLGGRKRRRER